MIAAVRRHLAEHPVRTIAVLWTLYTLVAINVKLFDPRGPWWRDWLDQKAYLASSRAFLHFDLNPDLHWYPLLYPLAGAPFAWMPAPYVPINTLCYVLVFVGFRRICARFDVGNMSAVLLFIATTALDRRIINLWVEPWTTTLSAAFVWLAFAEAARMMFGDAKQRPALLGALLMGIALVRPADVVISALIGLFALWRPVIVERRFAALLAVAASALAPLAAYAALYLAIYGPRLTDYTILSRDYGFNFADLGWKASILLVDPSAWFPGETGFLREIPWTLIGVAGLVLGVIQLRGAQRALALCLLLSGLAYCVLMLAYVDLLPTGFWRYFNVHYFKWLLPMLGLFTLLFVRWFDRRALTVLAVLVLLTCFHVTPRPAAAGEPAKALVFATPDASAADIFVARSVIRDARGDQRNPADYHQLLVGREVVAMAFKRRFEGDALWYGATPPGMAHWPNRSGHSDVVLPGPWPQTPVARWATQLRFGYPCWAPRFPCAPR